MVEYDDLIYNYVRLIPLGMVTTFYEIAKEIKEGAKGVSGIGARGKRRIIG